MPNSVKVVWLITSFIPILQCSGSGSGIIFPDLDPERMKEQMNLNFIHNFLTLKILDYCTEEL